MKVPEQAKSQGRPQLKPDRTGGADLVVATIASVEFRDSQFRKEPQPVLTFKEFPDAELRVGKRGTARLCERLGDETDDWIGERIPLIKSREEVGNKTFIVYQVAPTEEWDDLLKAAKRKK